MKLNKLNNPKTLTLLIIIIFIILGIIILSTLNLKRETATLTYDNTETTFIVPRGYEFNAKDSLDNLLRYKNTKNDDLIIYSLEQITKKQFKQIKKDIKQEYENIFNNVKIKEYSQVIKSKTITVFEVRYTPDHKKESKNTYIYYPLSNNYSAKITINNVNINKSNIKNYIKTK